MPRAEINDVMMFIHALGLLWLSFLIYRAAHRNEPGFWRRYPPELFFLWGTQVLINGLIHLRRVANRNGYDVAAYGGWLSLFLNVMAVIVLLALIYRISCGTDAKEQEGQHEGT